MSAADLDSILPSGNIPRNRSSLLMLLHDRRRSRGSMDNSGAGLEAFSNGTSSPRNSPRPASALTLPHIKTNSLTCHTQNGSSGDLSTADLSLAELDRLDLLTVEEHQQKQAHEMRKKRRSITFRIKNYVHAYRLKRKERREERQEALDSEADPAQTKHSPSLLQRFKSSKFYELLFGSKTGIAFTAVGVASALTLASLVAVAIVLVVLA